MLKALGSHSTGGARSFDRHLASLELLGTDVTRLAAYGVSPRSPSSTSGSAA